MTDDDRLRFEQASSAARKRADRERGILTHCRWHAGELEVVIGPAKGATVIVDPQGSLI